MNSAEKKGNVVILGVQGSGKTVFLSILGEELSRPGALGLQLTGKLRTGTRDYVREAYRRMRDENLWPQSTNEKDREELSWTVKCGSHPLFDVESLDCAGETIVRALAPRNDTFADSATQGRKSKRAKARKGADSVSWETDDGGESPSGTENEDAVEEWIRDRVLHADVVCLFLNPNDFESHIVAEGDGIGDADYIRSAQSRSDDMGRLVQTFLDGDLGNGKRIVLTVTQSGRSEILRRIEESGGAAAFLFDQWPELESWRHAKEAHVVAVSAVNDVLWIDRETGKPVAPDSYAENLSERFEGESWTGRKDGERHFRPREVPDLSGERPSSGLVEFLLAIGGSISRELKPIDDALRELRHLQFEHAVAVREGKSAKERLGIAEKIAELWRRYAALAREYVSCDAVSSPSRTKTEDYLDEEEGRFLCWTVAERTIDEALREAASEDRPLDSAAQCAAFRGEVAKRSEDRLLEAAGNPDRKNPLSGFRRLAADDLLIGDEWIRKQKNRYRDARKSFEAAFKEAVLRGERSVSEEDVQVTFAEAKTVREALLEWLPPSAFETVARKTGEDLESLGKRQRKNIDDAKDRAVFRRRIRHLLAASATVAAVATFCFLVRGALDWRFSRKRDEALELARQSRFDEAAKRMRGISGFRILFLPRAKYVDEKAIRRWDDAADFWDARRIAEKKRKEIEDAEASFVSMFGRNAGRLNALSGGKWNPYAEERDAFIKVFPEVNADSLIGDPVEGGDRAELENATKRYKEVSVLADRVLVRFAGIRKSADERRQVFVDARHKAEKALDDLAEDTARLRGEFQKDDARLEATVGDLWRDFLDAEAKAKAQFPASTEILSGLPPPDADFDSVLEQCKTVPALCKEAEEKRKLALDKFSLILAEEKRLNAVKESLAILKKATGIPPDGWPKAAALLKQKNGFPVFPELDELERAWNVVLAAGQGGKENSPIRIPDQKDWGSALKAAKEYGANARSSSEKGHAAAVLSVCRAAESFFVESERWKHPQLRVTASLDGTSVTGAVLSLGQQRLDLPKLLKFERNKMYGPGNVLFKRGVMTYVGTLDRTKADWKGVRKTEVKLREKAKVAGERVVIKTGSGSMSFRWCPPGAFTMGSPLSEEGRKEDEIQHSVTLSKGFWMGETEVTQGQWKALMNGETVIDLARKALHDDAKFQFADGETTFCEYFGVSRDSEPADLVFDPDDNTPVYFVSWNDAVRFCKALTERVRKSGSLPPGYVFRLPTEAEWEYACRAGTVTSLPNGTEIKIKGASNAPALDSIAWYGGNSSIGFSGGRGWDTEKWPEKQYPGGKAGPCRVGTKSANGWGLHDMIGNVGEWCVDWYGPHPTSQTTDPTGASSGMFRVPRGGSWNSEARACRSANRGRIGPSFRSIDLGFRVVLAPVLGRMMEVEQDSLDNAGSALPDDEPVKMDIPLHRPPTKSSDGNWACQGESSKIFISNVSWRAGGGYGTFNVGKIANQSSWDTGSLKLVLWFSSAPYNGGTLNGTQIGECIFSQEPLRAGYEFNNLEVSFQVQNNPPTGNYESIVTVNEYHESGSWYIVGWINMGTGFWNH